MPFDIVFRPNSEIQIINIFDKALGLIDPISFGRKGFDNHWFEKCIYALDYLITKIGLVTESPLKQAIISNTVTQFAKQKIPVDTISIKALLEIEYNKKNVTKGSSEFIVICPLNVKFSSLSKRKVKVDNSVISLKSHRSVKGYFKDPKNSPPKPFEIESARRSLDEYANHMEFKKNCNPDETFIFLKIQATDEGAAIDRAFELCTALRTIMNFRKFGGALKYTYGKPLDQQIWIVPPRIMFIFNSNGSPLDYANLPIPWLKTEPELIDFSDSKNRAVLKIGLKTIESINLKQQDLRDLLFKTLKIYNDALNYYDVPWIASLSFWQIVESLSLIKTLNSKNYRNSENKKFVASDACKHVSYLIEGKEDFGELEVLKNFKERRNAIVHEKFTDFPHNDINLVKDYIDFALFKIIRDKKIQSLNDLEDQFKSNIKSVP